MSTWFGSSTGRVGAAARRPSRAAAAITSAALVLGGSGCGWVSDGSTRVLVVGDSVTRLSQEEIRRRLDWTDTLDIRAHDGFRTDQLVGTARDGAGADPDIAIVMTGYNDVLQGTVETGALGQLVDAVSGVDCTVWLLLPKDGGYSAAAAERWNQRVRQAVAGHDSIHVSGEWQALVEESPGYTFVSDLDAVHPNDQGQQAVAEVMDRAADDACR